MAGGGDLSGSELMDANIPLFQMQGVAKR